MDERMKWKCMSPGLKKTITGIAAVEIALLAAALADIARRPAKNIRGRKLWWTLGSFVQFFGPVAYFVFGRRP